MAKLLHFVLISFLLLHFTSSSPSPSPSPSADSPSPPQISLPPSPSNSPATSPASASPPPPPSSDSPSPSPSPDSPADALVPEPASDVNHSDINADEGAVTAPGGGGGMSAGKKAGIGLGVIVAVGLVGLGGFVYKRRQDNIRRSQYGYAARREML